MPVYKVFIHQFMRRTEQIEAESPREAAASFRDLTGYCPDTVDGKEVIGFDTELEVAVFADEGHTLNTLGPGTLFLFDPKPENGPAPARPKRRRQKRTR